KDNALGRIERDSSSLKIRADGRADDVHCRLNGQEVDAALPSALPLARARSPCRSRRRLGSGTSQTATTATSAARRNTDTGVLRRAAGANSPLAAAAETATAAATATAAPAPRATLPEVLRAAEVQGRNALQAVQEGVRVDLVPAGVQ